MTESYSRIVSRLRDSNACRWLFLGDSITQGAEHTYGERDYTQIFSERVRWEMSRKKDLIINAAFSGATAADCLAGLDGILSCYVPQVALVMIGTNDAARERETTPEAFERELTAIVERLRKVASEIILQTPNPIVPESAVLYRDKFPAILGKIRAVAKREKVLLVDHEKHWELRSSEFAKSLAIYQMCDGIHPNAFGHRLLAANLFQALGIFDPLSTTGRQFIP